MTARMSSSWFSWFLPFRLSRLLSVMLVVAFTQSCANNLKPIQEFAGLSAESAEYTVLVEEYIESPNRQKRYQPPGRHANLEAMARERAAQQPALLLRQHLLEEYMKSLGRLSADKEIGQPAEVIAGFQNPPGTPPQDTEAYEKIAGILTKASTKRWKQNHLGDLIEQSNPFIQRLLESLHRLVVEGFGGDLQSEEAALHKYYSTLLMESKDPAGKAALAEWQEFRSAQVQDRAQAVQTYGALLEKISEGHQELYDRRHELANTRVLQHLANSVKDLRGLLDSIHNTYQ